MAQVRPVTSETLEAQIRDLLPSQNGFTEDLQASNVITPIIDLTPAAQGTNVPEYQAQAIGFDDITSWDAFNTTVTIANSPGFWVVGYTFAQEASTSAGSAKLYLDDGLSQKDLYNWTSPNNLANQFSPVVTNIVVFLTAGQSIVGSSNSGFRGVFNGFTRQLASVTGVIQSPTGFTPQ